MTNVIDIMNATEDGFDISIILFSTLNKHIVERKM